MTMSFKNLGGRPPRLRLLHERLVGKYQKKNKNFMLPSTVEDATRNVAVVKMWNKLFKAITGFIKKQYC